MSVQNYIKETISNLRNELTHVWTAAFIIGGGTFSLLWIDANPLKKWTFFTIGVFLMILFFVSYARRHTKLERLTSELLKLKLKGVSHGTYIR